MTTETVQHTPGPWETTRDAVPEWHTQITVYAESDGERVATVFRNEANARLIAAAPELLSALERLLASAQELRLWYHGSPPFGFGAAVDNARDVIASAAGFPDYESYNLRPRS